MFNLLSHAFPYEKMIIKLGFSESKMYPRNMHIAELLQKRNCHTHLHLTEQHKRPVMHVWDGLDRFVKTLEVQGNFLL